MSAPEAGMPDELMPDYHGGSIVNLMTSIGTRFGREGGLYPPLREFDAARLDEARRVVLLVVDGLGAEWLRKHAPVSALAQHQATTLTSVYPPTTATAVTTFLTGVPPQQSGLTGWFMHFRRLGAVLAVLPFVTRFRGRPLSETGVNMSELLDCPSFADSIRARSAALLPADIAHSDFSQLTGGNAERYGYHDLNDFSRQLQHLCSEEVDVDYVYAYWSQYDHLAHIHGPSSAAVKSHFQALDETLAPIIERCANSGTLLAITADHGFIDVAPARSVDVSSHGELVDALTMPLCGEPRTAYCYVRADRAARFEQYVANNLKDAATCHPSGSLIDEGYFGLGEPHPELLARLGDYTLIMNDDFTIGDRVLSERSFALNGVHGGRSHHEIFVPLVLAGP